MLKKMMEEFEKRQGFPVHSDMDIQTEVAWENWQAAWAAATAAQRDCRLCAYHTTKVGGCAATVRCVGGAQYKDTARRRYWDDYGLTVHLTPAIDDGCYHDWENGEDGNPERCSKCGLSFMRFIHSCCP